MIKLKTLASNIQDLLNESTSEYEFYIQADTGKVKKATRSGNSVTPYVNGLLSVISSDKSNLPDGTMFATMYCTLRFIVGILNPDAQSLEDMTITNTTKTVADLRAVIDNAFSKNTQTTMTDSKGTPYLTISTYQFASSGERGQTTVLGNTFTFSVSLGFMFVESGISGYEVTYSLDGKAIPSQMITDYRTATVDGNVYSDTLNGSTRALVSQSTFSVVIDLPALKNIVTQTIFSNIFDGDINTAHILTVTYPSFTGTGNVVKNYLVTFAESVAMAETIKNVGNRVTLYEICDDYELVSISDNLKVYQVVSVNSDNEIRLLVPSVSAGSTIYCFENKTFYSFDESSGPQILVLSNMAVGNHFISTFSVSQLSNSNITEIQ